MSLESGLSLQRRPRPLGSCADRPLDRRKRPLKARVWRPEQTKRAIRRSRAAPNRRPGVRAQWARPMAEQVARGSLTGPGRQGPNARRTSAAASRSSGLSGYVRLVRVTHRSHTRSVQAPMTPAFCSFSTERTNAFRRASGVSVSVIVPSWQYRRHRSTGTTSLSYRRWLLAPVFSPASVTGFLSKSSSLVLFPRAPELDHAGGPADPEASAPAAS
jgi:hypothetical protein